MDSKGPEVLIAEIPPVPKLPKKIPIMPVVLVLVILSVTSGLWYLSTKLPLSSIFKPKVEPKLIKDTTVSQVAVENHPSLFYADLEYDPKTGLVTQQSLGKANGDLPPLLSSPPPTSSDYLVYKMELISDKNVLLRSGWAALPKEVAQTPEQTLSFRVTALYESGSIVKVSIPEKGLIWTGRME